MFLQNLPCINSLSFRKCLKIFTSLQTKYFWPAITQLCIFRAHIIAFLNLFYYSLKRSGFFTDVKIKTTLVILLILLLGVPFHKYYVIVPLLKVISSIMSTKSTPVRNLLD